jgi:lipoprotein-anchoring transpeptidase ErfK/SrfK
MVSRRNVLKGLLAAVVPAPASAQTYYYYYYPSPYPAPYYPGMPAPATPAVPVVPQRPRRSWYRGSVRDGDKVVPLVDLSRIPDAYHRQSVRYEGDEEPGTVVIDTARRFLFLVREDGTALRYGIGVGRTGFAWSGTAEIRRKAQWPGWTPPPEMRRRQPGLPRHMPGGVGNPLGARALYLYQGDRDTLYRIHGTNEPWSIGKAVSSGCIRMLNQDVMDLHDRVPVGTQAVVREHRRGAG